MKKSELKKIILSIIKEGYEEKESDQFRYVIKLRQGGKTITGKWSSDYLRVEDELIDMVVKLATQMGNWDGKRITDPDMFKFRHMEGNFDKANRKAAAKAAKAEAMKPYEPGRYDMYGSNGESW